MPGRRTDSGDVIVVILGGGRGARLGPLTFRRSKPAVPIAGKYRLIDIPISNAIHSGMERILVLTQFNTVSLHRHIVRTYKFDPFSTGFVQILAAQQTPSGERWYQGTADAVRQNIDIIREMRGETVLILSGDHLYRMDYRWMMNDHVENDADVTLAVLPCSQAEIAGFGAVRVDDSGRIVEFREKPADAAARAGMEVAPELLEKSGCDQDRPYLASMGIYLFKKKLLIECLENELRDFGTDILPAEVDRRRVQAHIFGGYWRDIGTIRAFYEAHMDMVRPEPPFDFYDSDWPFYTHPRYLPGARLDNVRFTRSILAEGSRISDSTVEDSIIGVRTILRRATIRRSLVMGADYYAPGNGPGVPAVGIGPGSVIENAIVDKNARIGREVVVRNEDGIQEANGAGWVIREGVVMITKDAVIPDGTRI
jgi:glucose-1-phosphate adenylyltransferase